jgi:serine protease Do
MHPILVSATLWLAAAGASGAPLADVVTPVRAVTVAVWTHPSCLDEPNAGGAPEPYGDQFVDSLFGSQLDGEVDYWNRARSSQSSGVLLGKDGELLSLSLADGCDRFDVRFPDGLHAAARRVATDAPTTISLLRFEDPPPELGLVSPLPIGDPSALRAGDTVIAVSSPRDLHGTVGVGVVSDARRQIDDGSIRGYIQSDAAIHMGSAGGPLVNAAGQLVGLHAAIYSRSAQFEGLAFALPIDIALRIADGLRNSGAFHRGALGVVTEDVAPDNGRVRVTVSEVTPDTPAAGQLKVADVLLRVDGESLRSTADLVALIQYRAPGTPVRLDYSRDGQEASVELFLMDQAALQAVDTVSLPES